MYFMIIKDNFASFSINSSIQHFLPFQRRRCGLVVNTSDSGSRGPGFEPHSGRRVVFLSKTYLPSKEYW